MAAKSPKKTLQAPICSKCAGAMEQGNILDHGPYNIGMKAQWSKGGAEFSMSKGLKTSFGNRTVVTWRCTSCGYLESYAK